MKKSLLFLLLLATVLLKSQSVSINWDGIKEIPINETVQKKLPHFKNEGYSLVDNNPYFTYSREVSGKGIVKISNIQYAPVSNSEKGQLDMATIPSTLSYRAKVNQAGNQFFVTVGMTPFVKENNQLKKVTHFDINFQDGINPEFDVNETFDPATSSALKTGNWYKIKVKKSGVFKLDKNFFQQHNIPTNFDPRTLKIYGNGGKMLNENPGAFRYGALQENAIQFNGQDDGSFDGGDVIYFYAQGPHDWTRLPNSTLQNLRHRFNQYSDYAYYFITFGGAPGKRVQDVTIEGNPVQTFNQYDEYVFHEKDSISMNQLGKQWAGESFNVVPNQTFTLTGNAPAVGEAYAYFKVVGKDATGVSVSASVNGTAISNGTLGAGTYFEFPIQESQNNIPFTATGNSFAFNVAIGNNSNPGSFTFLDYIEIKYLANLTFNGTQMKFRRLQNLNDGNVYGFTLAGPQKVWNISDHTNAHNVVNAGGVYKYQSNSPFFLNEFVAFNEAAAYAEVEYVGTVANQDLREFTDIEYIVVTHPQYLSEAARFANFRIQNDDVKIKVVTTDQVYNDFSSGAQDVSGIRDFFKHLRDTGNPLKYVLMFGGASFDYKDRIPNNTNFVPAYISLNSKDLDESFVTDDYYTMLDDSDLILANIDRPSEFSTGSAGSQMDIAIGRFPAHDLNEMKIMVDKTISYYNKLPNQGTAFGDWRTKFLLIADDDKDGGNPFHQIVEESSASYISQNIPYATLRKGYLDAFVQEGTSAGPRYPAVNQLISNSFNLGTSLIVYFGHGGPRSWAQERVITYEEINNFSNYTGLFSRLPVVMTITCEFTVWDLPYLPSAGVYMFKAPLGGAAAMITTSRPVGVFFGGEFNRKIVEEVLTLDGDDYQALGTALTRAKVNQNSPFGLKINLLGDPMMSVVRPPRQLRITKINGEDAATFTGTLRAMDFVEIEGEVLNAQATQRDTSFNGKANATLFDKPVNKSTLNNDGDLGVMQFQEQVNSIFKGGTNVTNGKFTFQFYIPKDINYEVGLGKLMVYAHNNVVDGVTTKQISVGGQNPEGLNDDKGPTIGLYMNNLNFVDGGITNKNPYLLACLVDETGINTSGIAIGHDITGVLDQNLEGTYVLNEYYEGGDNNPCTNPQVLDYQKGQVMYRLSNLDLGNHQIVFKAWDINNNSSEQTLDFVVMHEGSQSIYIDKLLNWPNPFTNQTFFHFEHNCDSELEVMVQIFTVSGKLVKTIRQPVSAEPWREGYRTGRFAIPWDGLDDFGDKIGKGVYIYRVTARGVNPDICKGSATAVEKLVILK
jgi:hypothetical protein